MPPLTTSHLLSLLNRTEPPCISLYQPTHRHYPDNQQDPIRFKNLLVSMEGSLKEKYPVRSTRELMEPFHALAREQPFWNHARDGLAVFAGPGRFEVYRLQRTVPELLVVADSFHVKPLLRYLQSADRFHVLGLARDHVSFYEGNRYILDEIDLPKDFPTSQKQVIEPLSSERGYAVASSSGGVGSPKMVRGHGDKKVDVDTEKFFRAVDQSVRDLFSKPLGLPLVLIALPEHQATFRGISQNPMLLAEGVHLNPTALKDSEDVRRRVWQVLEPHYVSRLEKLKDCFYTAQARQAGTSDLSDAARAAVAGRVGMLLVESERVMPGTMDRSTGAIHSGELNSPTVDDLLDDLAEVVLATGGEVVMVPAERMPSATGIAAIFRY